MERRGLGRNGVEHVFGEVNRKVLGQVVDVVGVPARLSANNGDAAFGVASRHVGGEIEVEELVMKRPAIRNGGGWCRAHGENLKRVNPVEGELGLENGGVGAFLGALADGGNSVVDPRQTAGGERRGAAEGIHDGSVAAVKS